MTKDGLQYRNEDIRHKELAIFLHYLDRGEVTDDFTKELDKEVIGVKENVDWRLEYMNLALKIKEEKEETRIEDYAEGAMSFDWVMKKTGLSKEEIERKAEEYKKKK